MRPHVVVGTLVPVLLRLPKKCMAPASGTIKLDPSYVKSIGHDEADEMFCVSACCLINPAWVLLSPAAQRMRTCEM